MPLSNRHSTDAAAKPCGIPRPNKTTPKIRWPGKGPQETCVRRGEQRNPAPRRGRKLLLQSSVDFGCSRPWPGILPQGRRLDQGALIKRRFRNGLINRANIVSFCKLYNYCACYGNCSTACTVCYRRDSNHQLQNELGWSGRGVPGLSYRLLYAVPRRDHFWLFVISHSGGLAKHLFHGF